MPTLADAGLAAPVRPATKPALTRNAATRRPAAPTPVASKREAASVTQPVAKSLAAPRPVSLSGTITDEAGMPLPGATVWVAASASQVAVTNSSGDFTLLLPNNNPVRLRCGFAGFQEEQVELAHPRFKKDFFVSLQPAARN